MHHYYGEEKEISVEGLIEEQRRLARSKSPCERVVGSLYMSGILKERLARLTDKQIGQLVFDFVDEQLGVFDPETTICRHATLRLFRSSGGHLTVGEIERQEQRPACPKCGSEMIRHFGIEEPDFLKCALLDCGLRIQATKLNL